MKYSQNNIKLINDFLSMASFPFQKVNFQISDVKILIEQSFSDFGDADVILLLKDNEGEKHVVFLEAKVKTFQKSYWSILEEFEEFKRGIEKNNLKTSNLFVQLYHKVRLISALQIGGIKQLQNGVQFPRCSSKIDRKIGNNEVVLKAVNLLIDYCKNALFIALVPDNLPAIEDFYKNTLKDYYPTGFQNWDTKNWGYVSWKQIEEFCRKYNLMETLKNFEFNRGQIYGSSPTLIETYSPSNKWSKEKVFELMNKLNERQIKLMGILVGGNGREKQGVILQKLGSLGGKGSASSLQKIKIWINRKSVCGKIVPEGYGSGDERIHFIEPSVYEWIKDWFKERNERT